MSEMTSHERFSRMYEHREADRVPIIDEPWAATLERWRREGLPEDTDWTDFFGVDKTALIAVDNSPRYECKVLEETDDYIVETTCWGLTVKNWKHAASTPQFLDYTIRDPDSWREAKARMTPTRDRIPWATLEKNYATWRERGYWLSARLWFGFDVTHSWAVGTERMLMALIDNPDWCADMFNTYLDVNLALLEILLEEGYTFDCAIWPDDMGYKGHQFFSMQTYRDLLKPVQRRAIEWAHAHGMKAHLHSCGDVRPLVPELIEMGLDALNPLEVKAGMDTLWLKQTYGDDLVLHGGINAVLWDKPEAIQAEILQKTPALKKGGGYIFSSDHSVPSSVSLEQFRSIVNLAKSAGSY